MRAKAEQMTSDAGFEVRQHIVFLLRTCTSMAEEKIASVLSEFKLTPHSYFILLTILKTPNLSQKQVGEYLCLNVNTVTRLIDVLEERHLAKRVMNQENRKENLLEITAQGERVVKTAHSHAASVREATYEVLTKEELKELHRILLKMFRAWYRVEA